MSTRLVIPANALPTDVAFDGRTWQQIADRNGCDAIELRGSAWCLTNGVDGLGIATERPVVNDVPDTSIPVLRDNFARCVTLSQTSAARQANGLTLTAAKTWFGEIQEQLDLTRQSQRLLLSNYVRDKV